MRDYTLLLKKQMDRWYDLIAHPVQLNLLSAQDRGVRFCVVPAGRRSGKTERAKRFLVKRANLTPNELFFAGAPTYNQAKKIFWEDLKQLSLTATGGCTVSESELTITYPNGSQIVVLGFDKPQRFEGVPWTGGVIDEIANLKPDAVDLNILPALNTFNPTRPDYRAWCWFIGVPEGLNHYYDMAEYARLSGDPQWELFTWWSEDILPDDIIKAAKERMSPQQYEQEYRAAFVTAKGRIYPDYNQKNEVSEEILEHEALHWAHDFNFTPMCSCVVVIRNGMPYFLDEIVLEHAVARQTAVEFCEKFKERRNKMVFVYGDPAGRAGTKHGHKSDYDEIEEVLRINGWKFERRVRAKHPAIKDRQNAVRAMVLNALGLRRLFVNPVKCRWTHKGLATVQLKEGSTFQEDDTNEYQHVTTAIGYFVDYLWPMGSIQISSGLVSGHH